MKKILGSDEREDRVRRVCGFLIQLILKSSPDLYRVFTRYPQWKSVEKSLDSISIGIPCTEACSDVRIFQREVGGGGKEHHALIIMHNNVNSALRLT